MKYFDLIILVIGMLKINMAQHWYEMKTTYPMFIHSCNEKYVNSLLLCAALGREAKSVTFFSNSDTNLCRWNCTFIFSTDVSDEKSKWQKYDRCWLFCNDINYLVNVMSKKVMIFLMIWIENIFSAPNYLYDMNIQYIKP